MKLIIAGSRCFEDYEKLCKEVDEVADWNPITEILCGEAKGADSLGRRYAEDRGIKVSSYKPDWKVYGRAAGIRRNQRMAQDADALIAFWDGQSKGTWNMVQNMRDKFVKIVIFNKGEQHE